MPYSLVPLLAPLALLVGAVHAFRDSSPRPRHVLSVVEGCALAALLASLVSIPVVVRHGPGTSPAFGPHGSGLTIRLDAVSVPMVCLVSFVGWVVVRYAATYLDGEARQGAFMGWLCLALASVLLLVLAGNLAQLVPAWVATSLCLHRLLLHYPDRRAAQRAARKKFIVARIGDGALICAAVLLATGYGTIDTAAILAAAREGHGAGSAAAAASLLVIAAMLKSAQFPAHGWLIEVMEAPIPVSALLHAGVINAGGFLLIGS